MQPDLPPNSPPSTAPRSPDRLLQATQWVVLGAIALAWVGPAFSPSAEPAPEAPKPAIEQGR
jgi:hypothetical protein